MLGRKAWLPAYRDAVPFQVAYCWGYDAMRSDTSRPSIFTRNPHAREFGQ
jgi:hypothetical protein